MPRITVENLDNFGVRELENGKYHVSCIGASLSAQEGKRKSLVLKFKVEDGPEQSNGQSPYGKIITDFVFIEFEGMTKQGADINKDRLANACRALGLDSLSDFDTDQLIGATAFVTIKQEEYNGQVRAKIKSYYKG